MPLLTRDLAVRRFASASWTLADAPSDAGPHPWPARFVPALPAQAISALDIDGPVLDPFCGSGSTLLAARRSGLPSVGVDLHPLARRISAVRCDIGEPGCVATAEDMATALAVAVLDPAGPLSAHGPDIPRVDHWFSAEAILVLRRAMAFCSELAEPWRARVELAISATLIAISRQDSDTRYAAKGNGANPQEAARLLARAIRGVGRWLDANRRAELGGPSPELHTADARELEFIEPESMAAAIFSPPYPNAYEYWLYHKYRLYWLGEDPVRVRKRELGARPHYSGTGKRTGADFGREMGDVFAGVHRVMKPAGWMVVVVGDATIRGARLDVGALLCRQAQECGFVLCWAGRRVIPHSRRSFVHQSGRGRTHEHVLLLSRE